MGNMVSVYLWAMVFGDCGKCRIAVGWRGEFEVMDQWSSEHGIAAMHEHYAPSFEFQEHGCKRGQVWHVTKQEVML